MVILGRIGEVNEKGRSGGGFSFEWRIPNILSLNGKSGDVYTSPPFNACDGGWALSIHPYGIQHYTTSEWVGLFLVRGLRCPPKTLNVTLGIRGPEGVENKRERTQEFLYDDNACCWNKFCSRSVLKEQKSRLMPGDVLVITLDVKSIVPSVARDSYTQTVSTEESQSSEKQDSFTQTDKESNEPEVASEENHQSAAKQGGEKALEDFGKLLASGNKSDVTLQLGDVQFNVHSSILFARSPALSVSLQHESKEKASNKIVIEDCEPDAFRHFLHYLYTGSVQSLDEHTVFSLYSIADKYLAEDLKQHCLENITDTLSVETFCKSVKLALTYGESGLLQTAINFATENIRLIVRSVQWQEFNREYPTEANEIIIKSLGPP